MADTKVVKIDPNGDVVLICGTGDNEKRLQVSSSTLSRSSAVFRALLSPRFKEGNDLATSGFVEVPLPDDDPTSLAIVCNILHGQNEEVPHSLTVSEIHGVAVVTDKYACMQGLKFAANVWISPHVSETDPTVLSTLLSAAFYFQDHLLFDRISGNLIWYSVGRNSTDKFAGPDVLVDVLTAITKQHKESDKEISNLLEKPICYMSSMCFSAPGAACAACKGVLLKFIQVLATKQLWPGCKRSQVGLWRLFKEISELRIEPRDENNSLSCNSSAMERQIKAMKESADKLASQIKVPCFACVQQGKTGFGETCGHK